MKWSEYRKRLDVNLVLVVLLSVFAFAPLTRPGLHQSHSGFLPVFDLYDLERNLWGNWGWLPDAAGESAVLTREGPLPYLLAEFLRWLGIGGVQAIEGVYLVGFVASGLGMYLLGKELYGSRGGLVASVVYTYLPYHLATVYVRGAFAEAWAFVLYPFTLLCYEKFMSQRTALWGVAAIVLHASLALTNVGLALLFALFLLAYVLLLSPSRRARGQALLLLPASLGVAMLLQLPMALRHGLPVQSGEDFWQHFVYPFQLLSASWGYGTSLPGWDDTLPLQVGLVATGLTLFAGMLWLGAGEADPTLERRVSFFVITSVVLVLLLLHPAALIWRISLLSFLLRYPWQLLALVGLCMAVASGGAVGLARELGRFHWRAVLLTLTVLASYSYLTPHFTDVEVGGAPLAIAGDEMALLSYRREGPLLHGATVRLTLYWQALRPMDTDYTVFVHVVDPEGTIWGQSDAMPVQSEKPTSSWQTGEIVVDEHQLKIDLEGPRKGYSIEVGVYDPDTRERLPVSSRGTVVTLE
jgi:hypothetical protein